ncbi:hypothetical protein BDF22DRAFT_662535 [Syncephalis plumigaleata]|nr:hypothetical protein BDF22DRAFT_662535 [Syncephalis plumigaleata]
MCHYYCPFLLSKSLRVHTICTDLNQVCCSFFQAMALDRTPSSFLTEIVGKPVIVRLNSGIDYRGVLSCLDGYMNIALEQTEECVNGKVTHRFGDAFIRGNNVLYISVDKERWPAA